MVATLVTIAVLPVGAVTMDPVANSELAQLAFCGCATALMLRSTARMGLYKNASSRFASLKRELHARTRCSWRPRSVIGRYRRHATCSCPDAYKAKINTERDPEVC